MLPRIYADHYFLYHIFLIPFVNFNYQLSIFNKGVALRLIIMLELIKSITKPEWKFLLKVLVAVVVLTSLSRIFILLWMPAGYAPRGNTIMSFIDRYVYASYIEQAREGNFLFQDLFTAKEESAPMLNVFWLGAGLFARATDFSANFVLEFLRILFIPLLLFAAYLLLAYFIKNIFQRKLAFLLASLGGGLGFVLMPVLYLIELFYPKGAILRDLPIDLDNAETFLFTTNYYSAHFIFSTALFIFILLFALLAMDNKKLWYAAPAGVMGFVLANFHPFTFASLSFIFAAYFFYSLWKDRKEAFFLFKYLAISALLSLPSVAYHIHMFKNPWWQNQIWHSGTVTPYIWAIIFGYGLILVFAVCSLWLSFEKKLEIKKEGFLLVWLIGQIILVFLPVSVQGRFFEGYSLALIILASYSLARFLEKRKWLVSGKLYAGIAFFMCFGLSYFFLIFLDLRNIFLQGNLVYVPRDSFLAMAELKKDSGKDDLVLADIYNASMIPGVSLRRVFVGHGTETIDYDRKYEILKKFMASVDPLERKAILINNKINYLFYDGNWEKEWKFNPDDDQFLEKIYERGEYKIYKVK